MFSRANRAKKSTDQHMPKKTARKLALGGLVTVGLAAPIVAYAEQIDCSAAKKWSSDQHYKKGDKVWFNSGGNSNYEYECTASQCSGNADQPSTTNAHWHLLGWCKESTIKK
jgi:hypothetical protein